MKLYVGAAVTGALAVSACTTTGTARNGLCDPEPGQLFVGQKADAAAGLAIRQATGSHILRWAPPRSAQTMDFRQERVTVSYDDDMIITQVSCG
ncbi:MAG TPA: I78 family peptidase inhibitor [Croceibacterium sp.]|nr:I78 family peptidase inhibitor [Croceibacterium sp.]